MGLKSILLAGVAASLLGAAAIAAEPAGLEAKFDAQIHPEELGGWMKTLTSAPNQVGSPHDKANAEYLLSLFKDWGYQAHIETFDVLYPTPLSTTVEIVAPTPMPLGGQEPAVAGDETSAKTAGALPPYVAYQGDGDVTADVVYVNYGLPSDYIALERRGISVKGKIALARYGAGWRGLKPKLAQEHGAAGCLIYSDPHEDGYYRDDVYPKGGERPDFGVQRGSVADMTLYPGDPLTPGVGSTQDAKRLTRDQAQTILKIPTLPISYADATKILKDLGGPIAPDSFKGSLPLAYHLGGNGAVRLHLAVKSDWSLKTIYDVVAVLPGSQYPDQWVVRGNHHDAWVFGASDPISGHVAMMAEAKAIGALTKTGWKPKRSIVFTSWDAEEPMLLGSTEWAETHADELQKKAVVYINTDNIGRGFFHASGSHEYQALVNAVAADVIDPQTGVSVGQRARAKLIADAYERPGGEAASKAAEAGKDLPIGALGSGSDYSAFLQHLGVPSLDIGFMGEDDTGGVYHSVYDSYDHYVKFDDPGFAYSAALAKTTGRLILRIADAPTPPVRFSDLAETVSGYLDEVKKLTVEKREHAVTVAKLRAKDVYGVASGPLHPLAPPPAEPEVPVIDLAPLQASIAKLKASAAAYDAAAPKLAALSSAQRDKLNAALLTIDQTLLAPQGLPGRPWYQHLLYAPGRFTGYGAKTLPGVREAIEEGRWADAQAYVKLTAAALDAYSARIDYAAGIIAGQ